MTTTAKTGLQRLGDALTKAESENERLTYALQCVREHINGGNLDAALNLIEDTLDGE